MLKDFEHKKPEDKDQVGQEIKHFREQLLGQQQALRDPT